MQTLKLIVQCEETSVEILRYINEIIVQLNEMHVRVQIEKIPRDGMDDEMVKSLKKLGIRSLPALMMPGKAKPYIGVSEIKKLMEQNLNRLNNSKRFAPPNAPDAPPTELDDYWAREMTAGMKKGPKGKIEFENDGPVGEGQDFERKMADYRKKIPPHRVGAPRQQQEEEDPESPPVRRRRAQADAPAEPATRRQPRDNIDRTATTGDDETDRKMMAAWMDNNNID